VAEKGGKGLNQKTLLEEPPEQFALGEGPFQNLPEKYFSGGGDVDILVLFRVTQLFGDATAVAYAAWFN
jgi:hypothetical protein